MDSVSVFEYIPKRGKTTDRAMGNMVFVLSFNFENRLFKTRILQLVTSFWCICQKLPFLIQGAS